MVLYSLDDNQLAPTSKSLEAATTPLEQSVQPIMESEPAGAGNEVEPVSKPDDQLKILCDTEPLPEPVLSIITVSNNEDDDEESELVRSIPFICVKTS